MKDYCSSCDRLKEGQIDSGSNGTGWFYCFKCRNRLDSQIDDDLQKDYDYYNSLNQEQKDETDMEMRVHGVTWE